MTNRFLIGAVAMAIALSCAVFSAEPEEKKEHKYVGVGKCYLCHKGEKKANVFEILVKSPHFKAYATLATEKAKQAAKERGVEGDPQKSDKCLKCHSVRLGLGKGKLDEKAKFEYKLDGKKILSSSLGCEACHGPGSDYSKTDVMKDRALAVENGLWDAKKRCVTCHDKENDPDFDYEKAFPKIAHPLPAERRAEK